MDQTSLLQPSLRTSILPAFLAATIVVMILFFIDEGYYNFNWMADAGNWFVFGLYMMVFFPIQWVIAHFVFGRFTGWRKVLAMVALSVPATLVFFWIVF